MDNYIITMNRESSWDEVEAIFAAALERPDTEREAFVTARCGSDTDTASEVRKLLEARGRMGDFLQAPMLDFRGQAFGAYRAIEEIGRGGMSVVYRGERADGHFEKPTAIKVLLIQATSAPETRILASLEHPHIARLLDAGITAMGFRYLVMELVQGVPLTEYQGAATVPEKLRLFLQACSGVQAAHQALIVHRDLKPANILVTPEGVVKLLDFGIGKVLQPAAAEQTTGPRAYTIDYASPEQILGYPVSTSNDVYSLGLLLCELIAGRLPRQLSDLPLDEALRRLKEDEPVLPLTGDLAQIARKAMRAEPAERYESAGALAHDVDRYLAGQPVEARPATWGYRAGKFIRRHVYAVAGASLAVGALGVSTAYALRQARLAETRFEQVRSLSRSVLFDLHDAVNPLPGSLAARKQIVDSSLKYLDALASDSNAKEEVQLDVARGYLRLSDIEGKDLGGFSLGRSAEALLHAQKAVEIARRAVAQYGASNQARAVLVDALDFSTTALLLRGEAEKAVGPAEEGVRQAEQLLAAAPQWVEAQLRLATATKQLAHTYQRAGKKDQAAALFRRSIEMRKKLLDEAPSDLSRMQRYAEANNWLAAALFESKDYAGAEVAVREGMRVSEQLALKDRRKYGANLASDALLLSSLYMRGKRYAEAVEMMKQVLVIRQEVAAEEPNSVLAAMRVASAFDRLQNAYRKGGRLPEALEAGETALSQVRKIRQMDPGNAVASQELVYAMVDLALTRKAAGQERKACELARETLLFMKKPPKGMSPSVGASVKEAEKIAENCGGSLPRGRS
ncbi:protein kinase domain-containing protein [Paludibaculum fermentans]|uniref:protein kinase domain-containing protein n=1 Tax=Paludibaculum fermentans TaxID=1473598 RepID=UPI003EBE4A50